MMNAGTIMTFQGLLENLTRRMKQAPQVEQRRWQGVDVSKDPSARCYELQNVVFEVPLCGIEDLDHWRKQIEPNLPWADDHFLERVGGEPLNPGVQWANWPWASSADKHRKDQIFNHTYMERLWPKMARTNQPHRGIGWEYGDLNDLVDLLLRDPYTRQAWIPLFFPEDTGWGDGGRKPCTLGYQLLLREGKLGIFYPLRSCDFVRHFRDDIYLAVRLLLWVLDKLRQKDVFWEDVRAGNYAMWMTSLHVFENDRRLI